MHIGIFAEHYIGRYGADRALVILADSLRRNGHVVTLVGTKFVLPVVQQFDGHTVRFPETPPAKAEARTLMNLQHAQYFLQRHMPAFDVCIVTSSPFLSAIPYLRTISKRVIFLDFGVTPGGMDQHVRTLRQQHLAAVDRIVAISSFIAETSSKPDSGGKVPIETIALGADHLEAGLGDFHETIVDDRNDAVQVVEKLRSKGKKLILSLGRWEPGTYKNSDAAFGVLRSLLDFEPDAVLLVPHNSSYLNTPHDLAGKVFGIGWLSDGEMRDLMRKVDVAISVSLWEAFNLPLVEMQHLGKPALALRLAVNPEVAVSPEQLCNDADDMVNKLSRQLDRADAPWSAGSIAEWRTRFTWQRFGSDFNRMLERAA